MFLCCLICCYRPVEASGSFQISFFEWHQHKLTAVLKNLYIYGSYRKENVTSDLTPTLLLLQLIRSVLRRL